MRPGRPSATAAWIAAARAMSDLLPLDARLAADPYGARFAGRFAARLAGTSQRHPDLAPLLALATRPFLTGILWIQLRTRALDDVLREFVRGGGRQVVLLGAGYDCRAWRLHGELGGAVFYEIDHPATQARKRSVLEAAGAPADAGVRFLPWDFEHDPMPALPARLASLGHEAPERTLTLWEGVTPYLTPDAIEATVAAVRELSAPGSLLAFTYFDRAWLEQPTLRGRLVGRRVARLGEPFRFGWHPAELPAWLAERGFELIADRSEEQLARLLLPPRWARRFTGGRKHLAIARRS